MQVDQLTYVVPDFAEAPEILTIDHAGLATYESHTNARWPQRPEIGVYETLLSSSALENVQKLVQSPRLEQLPDHWGRVQAGGYFRRLTVRRDSQSVEKMVGAIEPVDPGLGAVFAGLDAIVDLAVQHRKMVLRAEARDVAVFADGRMSGSLSLTNIGASTFTCHRPAAVERGTSQEVSVEVWPDRPKAELKGTDLVRSPATMVDEVLSPGVRADSEALVMTPGSTVSYRIRAELGQIVQGSALVIRIAYTSRRSAQSKPAEFQGRLYTDMQNVVAKDK